VSAIVPIVEGQGEVEAVPLLLRRVLAEGAHYGTTVAKPFRVSRSKVVKAGELEKAIQLAATSRDDAGSILVILDSDDDDPATLIEALKKRGEAVTHLPVEVVAAVKEYECWLLGGKESLRGVCGIRSDASNPPAVETIRDGKGRLEANMTDNRRYVEVVDQPRLSAHLDIPMAAGNAHSFAELLAAVAHLIEAMGDSAGSPPEDNSDLVDAAT
jgi:hypothetical protein